MSPTEESTEDPGDVTCTFECEASSVEWKVVDATITEELNDPYQISLSLRANEADADATEMLGESCTVTIERGDLINKYAAVVYRVEDTAQGDRVTNVSVQASAALWMLSQNRQTKIFQNETVPEILDKVLKAGLSPYERKHKTDLTRTYPKCEYRVQYDESDLAFCERLMEEEGIIYRFDRDGSAEEVLLTDDPHASVDVESVKGKEVPFSAHTGIRECIQGITRESAMRPTKLTMRHFNWTLPSLPIEEEKEGQAQGDEADGSAIGPLRETYHHDRLPPTLYDYTDGDGYKSNDAKEQCQIRRDLDAIGKLNIEGYGTVVGFVAGGGFELTQHALEDEYVLTAVSHSFSAQAGASSYTNSFCCIPAETPYRPPRRTPKPRVLGLETATVVGPSGQEIHTDKHGRIRVQFPWDREGKNDDHSSCFIRVVQPWAGAGWGFVFIPRIGMEVTVAFVHGDPDRPIVTGCVYNGENLTPYALPDEMTKSTLRTQSSPGGDGYNELTFEDKAGEEEIFLQAQKDLREVVKNDQSLEVGKDQTIDVAENQSITVGTDLTESVGGDLSQTVDGSTTEEVEKDITMKSGKNTAISAGEAMKLKVGKDFSLGVDKKGAIKIADELTIKVGQASITMKKNGDITIKGMKVSIKGQSDVVIKGMKTGIN
jgi:type VI secretion system secreted protein VgrG